MDFSAYYKIACVGMQDVDIISLTKSLAGGGRLRGKLTKTGMNFSKIKFYMDTFTQDLDPISVKLWRIQYNQRYTRKAIQSYLLGTSMLLFFCKDLFSDTKIGIAEIMRITEEQWGPVPTFIIRVVEKPKKMNKKKFLEVLSTEYGESINRWCHFAKKMNCTDCYIIMDSDRHQLELLFSEILAIYDALPDDFVPQLPTT